MPNEEEVHVSREAWNERQTKMVRGIWGAVIGAPMVIVALVLSFHAMEEGLTKTEAIFIGGIALAGLVASMPNTFMPWIHKWVNSWEKRFLK